MRTFFVHILYPLQAWFQHRLEEEATMCRIMQPAAAFTATTYIIYGV